MRIKQIFCLILRYSDADGISSKQLSDLIWPDKPKDKVKNSRGVAINHLRKILKELDGIELVYEKGCFRFTLSSDFYCDYLRFMAIVAENRIEECRQEFLYIVGRGKFVEGGFRGAGLCGNCEFGRSGIQYRPGERDSLVLLPQVAFHTQA